MKSTRSVWCAKTPKNTLNEEDKAVRPLTKENPKQTLKTLARSIKKREETSKEKLLVLSTHQWMI